MTNDSGLDSQVKMSATNRKFLAQLSQALITSSQANNVLSQVDEEATRDYYISVMDSKIPFADKKSRILEELGRELIELIPAGDIRNNEITYTLVSNIMTESPVVISTDGSIITCGRLEENDIVVRSGTVSRVQFILFHIGDQILILDSWSANGTEVDQDETVKSSKPCSRRLLRFRDDEQITIILPNWRYRIYINAKSCIVCMDRVRQVRLGCNHAVLCYDCYLNIEENINRSCPICREPLSFKSLGIYYDSCISSPPVTTQYYSEDGDGKRRKL